VEKKEIAFLLRTMSTLRHRPGKVSRSEDGEGDNSPGVTSPDIDANADEARRATPDEKPTLNPIVRFKRWMLKPRGKRRNGFIFLLGGLFGVFVALFFANHTEVISLDALMDLNLDAIIEVIPQGLLRDAKEFTVCHIHKLSWTFLCVSTRLKLV
jgi:phospholipid:diacylglycerol acyltransferase